jgi:long-chain acyl-CoA synthetase
MTGLIHRLVTDEPRPGHTVTFARLGRTQTVPLRELHAKAGRVAAHLASLGIRRGDRIGILAGNSLEWALLDLAALRLGAVTAGLEPEKFAGRSQLVDDYDLALLFTDRELPGGERVRGTAEITGVAEGGGTAAAPEPVRWRPGEVTTLKFTSGSTGPAKALGATVASIDSSLAGVQEIFEHGPGDDLFVFLPLSLLQQRYWLYSAMVFGHDVTISTYEAAFWVLPLVQPTVVMGVPGFYATARRQIEARSRDTTAAEAVRAVLGGRIRYLWTGSAPAAPDLLRFFTDAGVPIYEGYGLNETCIATKNHPGAHRPGSVGRPLRGKRVVIEDDGVVSIVSDHPVNTRYEYAAPGDSERMFHPGGRVRTGDLGHMDDDGFLWIHGRADDVIVLDNGRKIVVRPIEERLKEHPGIDEVVLFHTGAAGLVAVVSPAADGRHDPDALRAHLAATNQTLADDEQVTRMVLARPFPDEPDLLTSQFKPRRPRIFEVYRRQITDPREGIHV